MNYVIIFFFRIIEVLTTEVEYTAMRMLLYVYENKQFYLCELIYFQHYKMSITGVI